MPTPQHTTSYLHSVIISLTTHPFLKEVLYRPKSTMKFPALLLSASAIIGATFAFEHNLDEEHIDRYLGEEHEHGRKLFFHYSKKARFEKYLSIYERCCGESQEECKCPVRDLTWFGIKEKWDTACDTTILEKSSIAALAHANDGIFSTLLSLLGGADLVDTLSKANGEGGYTVLAPTDAAFDALPDDFDPTPEEIKQVLLYHVVSGTFKAEDLTNGQVVRTLNGQDLTIGTGDGVTINGDVDVTSADNMASNGVVHIIDSVLVPNFD
jgi:uncharacterized surface protein with fasciclin (FAS1) repeats